ncbi:hypothetical protein J7J58_02055 [candidate division WOR-3 bacterium]|nr:hypothetical protein [candidate division WOR-3 bacterium]
MKKLILLIIFPVAIWAKPVVFSTLSKTTLNTGDTLTMIITLRDSVNRKYIYPMNDTSLGDFLLLKTEERSDVGETKIGFKLLFKGVDKDSVPPFQIYYSEKGETDSITTPTVYTGYMSLIGKDTLNKAIKADEPQVSIKHNWLFYIVIFLITVSIVILVLYLINLLKKRFRKKTHMEEKEIVSLKDKVKGMLSNLKIPNATDKDAVKEYYYGLSYILRYFVDGNFGTNTTDMTSSEFIKTLRKLNIEKDDIKSIKENIDRFDMIKYASETGKSKMEKDIEFVKSFVEKYYREEQEEENESLGK